MKKLAFAVTGAAAALMLGACHNGNQDAVQNAEMNQPTAEELNDLSNQAAMDAANMEAENLAAQQQKLQSENAADSAANPKEADEQNVSGM